MFCALLGQDIRLAFTGSLELWFSNIFSETAWQINAKFNVEPPWEVGNKVYINGIGHMTKKPPCPYMVKTFKNLLLQNLKSCDLETWHVALGTQ